MLWNDVEGKIAERSLLLVATRDVVEKPIAHRPHRRIEHGRSGQRCLRLETCFRSPVVEVRRVLNLVVFIEETDDSARTPFVRGAQAQFMTLVRISRDVALGLTRGITNV